MVRKVMKFIVDKLPVFAIALCGVSAFVVVACSPFTGTTNIFDEVVPLSAGEFQAKGVADFPGEDIDELNNGGISVTADFSHTGIGLVKVDIDCGEEDSCYVSLLPAEDARERSSEQGFYDSKLKPHGNSGVYSLTHGSGEYELCVWLKEDKADEYRSNYRKIYMKLFTADFMDEAPFLYSNANSVFEEDSLAAAYAHALIAEKINDLEKAKAIIAFVHDRIEYDEDSPYDEEFFMTADEILEEGKGLCYHFTGLASAMLKSVGIPAKEVRGTHRSLAGRHAWCEVYVEGKWYTADPTWFSGFPLNASRYYPEENANPHN